MAKVNQPNSQQNYRSPRSLLSAIEARFGKFTFDAACTSDDCVIEDRETSWEGIPCHRVSGFYFDEGVNALEQDWSELTGHVYCNPPFKLAGKFAKKISDSGIWLPDSRGPKVSLVVPFGSDTNWYWNYVHGKALVLSLSPRVPFLNPDGSSVLDGKGKPAAINRPMICAIYGEPPGFERWVWQEKKPRRCA